MINPVVKLFVSLESRPNMQTRLKADIPPFTERLNTLESRAKLVMESLTRERVGSSDTAKPSKQSNPCGRRSNRRKVGTDKNYKLSAHETRELLETVLPF